VQTIFSSTDTPQLPTNTDNRALVLGLRFSSSVIGDITAFRFFKSASEGGSGHMGRIYNRSNGQLLASTAAFSDDSCPGPRWVSVPLFAPLRTVVGREYTVAVDSLMHYAKTDSMAWPRVSGALSALGATYGFGLGTMPNEPSWMNAHYWVDGKQQFPNDSE
jgi:hypothetical protein